MNKFFLMLCCIFLTAVLFSEAEKMFLGFTKYLAIMGGFFIFIFTGNIA